MIDPLYVVSGFGVGLLVGMTGVGGGSLMRPLLILLFGIHPAPAVGTDLLYAAATKTGGTLAHGWARSIHWPAVIFRKALMDRYRWRLQQLDAGTAARATVLVGAALGVLVSISSVGAGAVGVTALLLLYPQLPMARIVGSDIAHAVPLTLVAGIGHWATRAIDWHLLGVLLVGSLPGIAIGSLCAPRVP